MIPGVGLWSLILRPRLAPPQMIEANVGDNSVEPGIKAAFEAKAVKIAVNLEECLLINVPRVFRALHQVQRQPQHIPVEAVHKLLESRTVAGLSFRHEGALV